MLSAASLAAVSNSISFGQSNQDDPADSAPSGRSPGFSDLYDIPEGQETGPPGGPRPPGNAPSPQGQRDIAPWGTPFQPPPPLPPDAVAPDITHRQESDNENPPLSGKGRTGKGRSPVQQATGPDNLVPGRHDGQYPPNLPQGKPLLPGALPPNVPAVKDFPITGDFPPYPETRGPWGSNPEFNGPPPGWPVRSGNDSGKGPNDLPPGSGMRGPWGGGPGLSPEQREQRRQRLLKMFDKNGDGQLDENERAQMRAYMQQRRQERMQRWQQEQQHGPGGAPSNEQPPD